MTRPSLLFIELNEFNPEFLAWSAEMLGLANIQKVLSWPRSITTTEDEIESQGLDPWTQWVSVHSGRPLKDHGVLRLGTTRSQAYPQLWHKVAERGFDWGAWGVMNAPMGDGKGCRFFMPDPWSFEETAYPPRLNDLLALPRHVAKNYFDVDKGQALGALIRLARFAPPSHWKLLAAFGVETVKASVVAGPNVHTFTTLLDYLSVLYFLRLRRTTGPALSIVFLNHIAHLQHQFWLEGKALHPEMKLGLKLCDAMLDLLLRDRREGEAVVVMNAFRQRNVAGKGYYCYRQHNPQEALTKIGIGGGRAEQNMTNDGTILFESVDEAEKAESLLEGCILSDGQRVFFVERQGDTRVFYQLDFKREVKPGTLLVCGDLRLPFEALFQLVCERTGEHMPEGDIFHDGIDLPPTLQNHDVFHRILEFFPPHA